MNLGGGGGGDKPWSKNGDKCQMGGLTKFLLDVLPSIKVVGYMGFAQKV